MPQCKLICPLILAVLVLYLFMNLFDIDRGERIELRQIEGNIDQYRIFFQGGQLEGMGEGQVLRIIKENPSKVFTVKRKELIKKGKGLNIQRLISLIKKEHKFTQNQLELIRNQPEMIFQKQIFQYKFALDQNQQKISKEREQQLVGMILSQSKEWKQASLEELEVVSANFPAILQKSIDI